jgi:hypothetical protein
MERYVPRRTEPHGATAASAFHFTLQRMADAPVSFMCAALPFSERFAFSINIRPCCIEHRPVNNSRVMVWYP